MTGHLWRALVVATAIIATACQSGTTAAPSASAGGTAGTSAPAVTQKLVWAYAFQPIGSWALESDDANALVRLGVAETLTKVGFDGKTGPSLATSWTQVDPLTWEFSIREGVRFQDGTAMDADAVTFALNHLLQAKVPARSFNPKSIKAIQTVGANKIRITSTSANPLIPLYAASPSAAILGKKAFAGVAVDPLGSGTGPFTMTKADLPSSVTLKGNAAYWGGPVGLADVEVRFIPDANTRATLARTGEAQISSVIPISALPALKASSNVKLATVSEPRTMAVYMNNAKAPFTDVRVRQAIQAAIDVKSIASDILEGNVAAATGPFVGNAPYAPAGAQLAAYDIAKAQDLFKQASIDPKTLTLDLWTYPERAELPSVAVAIQAMLKKLGVTVNVRVAAYNSLIDDALAGRYQMFLVSRSYLQDLNDPASYFQSDYACGGSYDLSQLCSSSLDAQIGKAVATADIDARYAQYRDIATQLQTTAVAVFLFNSSQIDAYAGTLQNYKMHPLITYVLTPDLSLKAKE